MLNRELTRQWIDRLRSGGYIQGEGWLHRDNEYCCLGVACTMLVERGDLHEDTSGWFADDLTEVTRGNSKALPPRAVELMGMNEIGDAMPDFARWLEARDEFPGESAIVIRGFCLTGLNDSGYSFDRIADLLELALTYEAETGDDAFGDRVPLFRAEPVAANGQTASTATPDAPTV